jgi:hypothetical protein
VGQVTKGTDDCVERLKAARVPTVEISSADLPYTFEMWSDRGAKLLDRDEPGWWTSIDLKRLDSGSWHDVLGQRHAGILACQWLDGHGFGGPENARRWEHGFGLPYDLVVYEAGGRVASAETRRFYNRLTAAWALLVQQRRIGERMAVA